MKLRGLGSLLMILLAVSAYGQDSRFGKLRIEDTEETKHKLMLNNKGLYYYEGQSIEILNVFNGKDRDFVILGLNSGGMACPVKVAIIEIWKSGEHRQSESFGSCSDEIKSSFINGKVMVETPMYAPHPEQLSKAELKRRERSKEVYTWFQSRLAKAIKPR
jgi:hypothetical protein